VVPVTARNIEFTSLSCIFTPVTNAANIFTCPQCGHPYDPQLRFCIKCGAKLPETSPKSPHGKDSGAEPDPEKLLEEPAYYGGGAAENGTSKGKSKPELEKYGGENPEEKQKVKRAEPVHPASGCLMGTLIIASMVFPPIGVVTAIAWAFLKPYRKAVLPAFLATIAGIAIWGYIIWGGMRADMYNEPYQIIEAYITAQSNANSESGHYMSMMELKRHGYLKPDFPGETKTEIHIIEHVLGPTGFVVEVSPADEDAKFFRIESLWSDHTGDVRLGGIDGPKFEPPS